MDRLPILLGLLKNLCPPLAALDDELLGFVDQLLHRAAGPRHDVDRGLPSQRHLGVALLLSPLPHGFALGQRAGHHLLEPGSHPLERRMAVASLAAGPLRHHPPQLGILGPQLLDLGLGHSGAGGRLFQPSIQPADVLVDLQPVVASHRRREFRQGRTDNGDVVGLGFHCGAFHQILRHF